MPESPNHPLRRLWRSLDTYKDALPLVILRVAFIIAASSLSIQLFRRPGILPAGTSEAMVVALTTAGAIIVVALDYFYREKLFGTLTSIIFGTIVGLFLTYVAGLALGIWIINEAQRNAVQMLIGAVICYSLVSFLLQTRGDFRFIIPYVEFVKEMKGRKPYVLDTSVIIDGRIADVVEAKLFDSQLVIPRFVIGELQGIADSSDKLRRSRGRRGLDILNRLRNNAEVDLDIFDRDLPEFQGQPVDLKLVLLAKHLEGKVITNDFNLNKVARLHGVDVINLNQIANALKPVYLPGEKLDVMIVKAGEEPGQGVGYLDDGTMIVVESGRDHVQETVEITVTSVLQTSAGRMIFGRFEQSNGGKRPGGQKGRTAQKA
ncbi:MAG: PIN/TRAM domain-containing protein [Planctomycetales bacterium]|nr:PIN/TRAM domain-containing protein [Planctomycetales bacterium]